MRVQGVDGMELSRMRIATRSPCFASRRFSASTILQLLFYLLYPLCHWTVFGTVVIASADCLEMASHPRAPGCCHDLCSLIFHLVDSTKHLGNLIAELTIFCSQRKGVVKFSPDIEQQIVGKLRHHTFQERTI